MADRTLCFYLVVLGVLLLTGFARSGPAGTPLTRLTVPAELRPAAYQPEKLDSRLLAIAFTCQIDR